MHRGLFNSMDLDRDRNSADPTSSYSMQRAESNAADMSVNHSILFWMSIALIGLGWACPWCQKYSNLSCIVSATVTGVQYTEASAPHGASLSRVPAMWPCFTLLVITLWLRTLMMVHERQVTIHCAVVLVAAFDSITESGLPAAYHMHAPLYHELCTSVPILQSCY